MSAAGHLLSPSLLGTTPGNSEELAADLAAGLRAALEGARPEAACFLRVRGASDEAAEADGALPAGAVEMGNSPLAASSDGSASLADSNDDGLLSTGWRERLAAMAPLTRRLLAHNEPPASISAAALLREVCEEAPYSQYCAAKAALAGGEAGTVLLARAVLAADKCSALRTALDEDGTSTIDSVDEQREHVLYLSPAELRAIVGDEGVRRLHALPRRFSEEEAIANVANAHSADTTAASAGEKYELFDCFLRRYAATDGDQLLTSIHADTATLTVNVALTSDADVVGGTLLGVYDGAVRAIPRGAGDATVHSSALLHGVTRMRAGIRYSMICFYSRAR